MANANLVQVIIKDNLTPHFEWRLYVLDPPYFRDAAHTEAISALDGFAEIFLHQNLSTIRSFAAT